MICVPRAAEWGCFCTGTCAEVVLTGDPTASAGSGINGCADMGPVNLGCGGDAAGGRTPTTCPPACASVFSAWMSVCVEAAGVPALVEFQQLCAATPGGSGH
jgi:hypothetical protein